MKLSFKMSYTMICDIKLSFAVQGRRRSWASQTSCSTSWRESRACTEKGNSVLVFGLVHYTLLFNIMLAFVFHHYCHCIFKVSDEFTDAFDTLADRFGSGPMFQFTSSLGGSVDTPLIEQVGNYRIQYLQQLLNL